ncbi:hypothetical protein, partial [Chryseobacterium sp. HMWF001]
MNMKKYLLVLLTICFNLICAQEKDTVYEKTFKAEGLNPNIQKTIKEKKKISWHFNTHYRYKWDSYRMHYFMSKKITAHDSCDIAFYTNGNSCIYFAPNCHADKSTRVYQFSDEIPYVFLQNKSNSEIKKLSDLNYYSYSDSSSKQFHDKKRQKKDYKDLELKLIETKNYDKYTLYRYKIIHDKY